MVEFWNYNKQASLVASLGGVFDGALSDTHVLDISGNDGDASIISAGATIDAKGLLGDKA